MTDKTITIKSAFEHGKAFIPFITAGDPSLDVTEKLILACEEAGADLIEIGIPFPILRLRDLSSRRQMRERCQVV